MHIIWGLMLGLNLSAGIANCTDGHLLLGGLNLAMAVWCGCKLFEALTAITA